MPPKLNPASDRVEACFRAASELRDRHGSANKAAKAYNLSQPTLSQLLADRKLGIDFADQIAEVFETTVDGLVWLFLRGGDGAVKAGNIPGWQKAVDDARGTMPDLPYEVAAETVLMGGPRVATVGFVQDLALVYQKHATASRARIRAQKAGS